ncbi:MAG: B12-binding domain-containing radical SAM protein [Lachnospiraceae bacterium]|nr:B12-binding domain-containing radical SAM protein [Lachnospiraceae bacterium]
MQNKVLLVAINAKYIHSNLAVYCLKEYSKEYENEIEIAEYTINQYTDFIVQSIYKKRPKIIAFSCYIWNISYVNIIIKNLRKILKDVEIWVGGPEVSYRARNYLEEFPQVNGVMIGEGEKTFNKLCGYWFKNEYELSDIDGIVYRKNDKEILLNSKTALMDLSEVPFPYNDIEKFKNKIIYYESSRGCPFSCSYCLSSIDKQLRFRDINLVKKELKFFIDNKIPQVKFVDRTFNCKKSHAMEIWNFIYENDNGITNFHFEISADLLDDEAIELISRMREGLIQLEIGVQTTNLKTIKEINRTTNIDKLREVVKKINGFKNTHQHLDLIAGLPYEDLESFKKSFNDVYEMSPEQLQLGFLKVLSGALMEKKSKEYEIEICDEPPYEVLSTKWLSYDDILELKKIENMVEIYYNSRQFVNTISYLEKKFKTPYEMYEELGNYYEVHKLDEVKHSRIKLYENLLEFVNEYFEDDEIFSEILKLDIYLRENIKSRPGFAENEYKEILRPFYRKYKSVYKMVHIEMFRINILKWIKDREIVKDNQIILFDYNKISPINHCCNILELKEEDISGE